MDAPPVDQAGPAPVPAAPAVANPAAAALIPCLAILSLGAAGIHFAYAPAHFAEYWAFGLFFTALAWAQVAWGVAVLVRPSRLLLTLGLANALVIALWALSRTAGLPLGPEPGVAESVAFVDVLASVLEGGVVLGSAFLLSARRDTVATTTTTTAAAGRSPIARAAWPVIGAGVFALSALSFTPAMAAAHDHEDEAAHTEAEAVDGHAHADEEQAAADGHAHTGDVVAAVTPESVAADAAAAGTEAAGGHGHSGPAPAVFIEDRAVRDALAGQLRTAREAADRYPTAADAKADGYVRVTTYIAKIGAHWMKFANVDGRLDPAAPEMLLYDGNGLDARMVGLSYYLVSATEPEGFAGPNDLWHQHIGLCVRGVQVVGPSTQTDAECKARGGVKADGSQAWMTHAWVVPGWESPWGLFSAEHPDLR